METHQKDIEEKDPFGQNRNDEADDEADDEKSFLKALLAERALKNTYSTFKVETNRPNKKRTETYCSIVPNGADIAVETD